VRRLETRGYGGLDECVHAFTLRLMAEMHRDALLVQSSEIIGLLYTCHRQNGVTSIVSVGLVTLKEIIVTVTNTTATTTPI